ncbi:MAG TPA: tRNA (adenosine(37)-N6)-threonylcarbamoyltransferase complex dimerization subunit type 1 TsaB [Gammaproteobacteria bacterium]|nr:tRNA (adenosine(37)-N6)-threonylcarbamoyltransferase complex dimerization subunit type 1 TsaB [Gammaproteobacteria bacterium]|tara:strand:+ start:833 stop:1495 length:663 start_codon:yes stop_codon:yes gene_type:complete
MTKCIAIDTSTRRFCLGVKNSRDYFDRSVDESTDHAKEIFKRIDDVLKLANTSIKELDFLAVGIGPGRFSGLRVSISAIKSISYVLNIPIIAISSLEIIAREMMEKNDKENVILIEDAGRGNLYIGSYALKNHEFIKLSDDRVANINEIEISEKDVLIAGSGIIRYPDLKIDSKSLLNQTGEEYLNSRTMIDHAVEQFNKGNTIDCMNLRPNYLFDEVAN